MNILITGASGFVGGALARQMAAEGHTVIGTGRNPGVAPRLMAAGVRYEVCDLNDTQRLNTLCAGAEVVYHCAALSAPWGKFEDFYNANVVGTANVLAACRRAGVRRLVHLSTPSLYFHYAPRLNVKEDDPLPTPANSYVATKRLAEQAVLAARGELEVIILRPRAIFGPGDTSLFPRLVARLAQSRLPLIGDGKTLTDLTYIENLTAVLVQCATVGSAAVGGIYNITNGEPVRLWDFIAELALQLGYPPPTRRVPASVMMTVAGGLEALWATLRLRGEPPLTRFAVSALAHSTTLDISAARRDLGYSPTISVWEGLRRLANP